MSMAEGIRSFHQPNVVKEIGETVYVTNEWIDIRTKVMKDLMGIKFQDPKFKTVLLASYPKELSHNVANTSHFGAQDRKGKVRI